MEDHLIPPIIKFRIIETFASTFGAALVLAFWFGVPIEGVIGLLVIGQIIGILFEGLGQNFAMAAKRVPDINNIIHHHNININIIHQTFCNIIHQ